MTPESRPLPTKPGSVGEVFGVMARLGCFAFGGPVAHLAHFQKELIEKRRWIGASEYADLIAFSQFLPGPASTQVGMGLGLMRAGLPGMIAAWVAFSGPSILLLLAAAAGFGTMTNGSLGWLHGLLAGVVAIVAEAVWKMSKKLCPHRRHVTLALAGAGAMIAFPHTLMQIAVIFGGAIGGLIWLDRPQAIPDDGKGVRVSRATVAFGWATLIIGVALPVAWSNLTTADEPSLLNVYGAFSQTGALVFGGGHVVLPMLQAEVVAPGWMTDEQFLTGYGVTQAMPGPIFTLSGYLGAVVGHNVDGTWTSFFSTAGAALLGIFAPSFGFVAALFPLWHRMRSSVRARQALGGINAAVVGLLVAALYDPVWTKAMQGDHVPWSVTIALLSWLLLVNWKRPAWLVLLLAAGVGAAVLDVSA